MKQIWKNKKLSEICDFSNGLWTGKKPPFQNVGVIRNTNFTKDGMVDDSDIVYLDVEQSQFAKRKLQYGDIILEKSGGGPKQPVGRVVIFDKKEGDYSFSNFTSVIRIKNSDEVDFNYLHRYLFFAYLSGSTETMQSHSTGIRNLKFDEYKEIEIPIPPLPEQQRIVSILDKAFAAIDKAKANAEQNLKNAKELFESYLQSVFENKGDGWEEKTLGEVIKLEYGKPLDPTKRNPNGKYPMYGANGIKGRTDEFYHNKKSIIVGRKGSAGEINLTEDKFWPLDVTYFVTFDSKKYDLIFLYFLLSKLDLPKLAKGVKPGINRNEVYEIHSSFPQLDEQQTIVRKLDTLRVATKKLESIYQKKIESLEELKKSILQKAFSGGV